MAEKIKLIAELLYEPDPARFPDAKNIEEIAERELDHAPDLLIGSGDTVYRYEIVGRPAVAPPEPEAEARALIETVERFLADLKARYGKDPAR